MPPEGDPWVCDMCGRSFGMRADAYVQNERVKARHQEYDVAALIREVEEYLKEHAA